MGWENVSVGDAARDGGVEFFGAPHQVVQPGHVTALVLKVVVVAGGPGDVGR
jgi:hypothetical protein